MWQKRHSGKEEKFKRQLSLPQGYSWRRFLHWDAGAVAMDEVAICN